MRRNRTKGFSLAELLISLLVISIVLAAAIPTITKRNSAASEKIWHWTNTNNSAYFGVGGNQSALLGADQIPFNEKMGDANYINNYFSDADIFQNDLDRQAVAGHFTTSGDKLVIMKRTVSADNPTDKTKKVGLSSFMNSHIAFYNIENKSTATPNDIVYAGRLALDKHNIALGIGSLQTLLPDKIGENTAIGHYSLLFNYAGQRNTAVGEKSLSYNKQGNENTALGFSALRSLTTATDEDPELAHYNTALGALALSMHTTGAHNTAVGRNSMGVQNEGSYNTAIGDSSCVNLEGNYNICLGYGTTPIYKKDTDGTSKYSLNIGVAREKHNANDLYEPESDTPIISGNMVAHYDKGTLVEKQLNINSKIFSVNTYNAAKPTFYVISSLYGAGGEKASDGYAPKSSNPVATGDFFYNFRDAGKNVGANSISMTVSGKENINGAPRTVEINTFDRYNTNNKVATFADFFINERFILDFDGSSGSRVTLRVLDPKPTSGTSYKVLSLQDIAQTAISDDGRETFELINDSGDSSFFFNKQDNNFGIIANIIDLNAQSLVARYKDSIYISSEKDIQFYTKNGIQSFGDLIVKPSGSSSSASGVTITGSGINVANSIHIGRDGKNSSDDIVIGSLKVKEEIEQLQRQVRNLMMGGGYSDARLKNIQGDNTAGLKEINALEVKNYTYKEDKDKTPHVGVIAQQLQKVFPNSVSKDNKGYLMIKTEEIFYAMVNSIKELCAQVQDLTAKIVGLDNRINKLEQENQLLKKQNAEFEKRLAKLEKQASK